MNNKTITSWIMYHEVQKLQRDGLSPLAITKYLAINRRTVVKYLAISEAGYEEFLLQNDSRTKLLGTFELFVKDRLQAHPASSPAQVHVVKRTPQTFSGHLPQNRL